MTDPDVLVVGAGFAGAVAARVLADAGLRVLVIDRRDHLAGNAFDGPDMHGVRIHWYGPHIFHTNSQRIFDWLSRFTEWRPYEHRVLADVDGTLVPMPINRTTINRLYGLDLDQDGVRRHLSKVALPVAHPANSEEVVLGAVGQDLCDRLYRGYTRKHWGLELHELQPSVAARIPVRTDDDDRYFSDRFQAMPLHGYVELFHRMLTHERIAVELARPFDPARDRARAGHLVFSGPIDEFFDFRLGRLPYRSVVFEHEHLPGTELLLPVASINYPDERPYTRVTEVKHITGQRCRGTTLTRDYPSAEGPPYYPIPTTANEALYRRYRALADAEANVTFVGRLAEYRYYNMDQAAAAGMKAALALTAALQPARG